MTENPSRIRNRYRFEFGRDVLGPVFYEFCHRLHLLVGRRHEETAILLFMSRAGIRLRRLYQAYLLSQKIPVCKTSYRDFYISRLSCARACMPHNPEYVSRVIISEYLSFSLGELVRRVFDTDLPKPLGTARVSVDSLLEVYHSPRDYGQRIRENTGHQSSLLRKYLSTVTQSRKNIVLVDSGWHGTTQSMLTRSFKDYSWFGFYFGLRGKSGAGLDHASFKVGLAVDDRHHSPLCPRFCIFDYYHLIESVLEPDVPSVNRYVETEGLVRSDVECLEVSERVLWGDDMFMGVTEYFKRPAGVDSGTIDAAATRAYRRLNRLVYFPDRVAATTMQVNDRAADFGKPGICPIVSRVDWMSAGTLRQQRRLIRKSLWKPAQIAVMYPAPLSRILQLLFYFYRKCFPR